jgi:4-amino-4-deoxy-L-arabinose transferase-like glycosyltransferase
MPPLRTSPGALTGRLRAAWMTGWPAATLIVAGAAVLRLAHIGAVAADPFYDGAVRSMTLSWHNFFFGALEPAGSVAIDKPPLDLWLQVASVKLFGFGSTALKLPEALGGSAAVALLFAAVRRPFGTRAGLAAALVLAVLPVEVITSRSDTMDAVMMALLVLALLLVLRAGETGGTAWLLAAAVALGLAFNVKLLESLVALPGLLLVAWLGMPGARRRRFAQLLAATAVYVAIALSWLTATLLFAPHDRPYAYGSTNGSAWNAAFVFNGLDRIEGKTVASQQPGFLRNHHYPERTQAERDHIPITPPSATRLLDRVGPLSGERLGLELLAALLLGLTVLAASLHEQLGTAGAQRSPPRARWAALAGLLLWLLTGAILFSQMTRLHPRYTEGFTPAVAGTLGIGVAWASALRTLWRVLALWVTLLVVVVYSEHLLFGTIAIWWVVLAGALGALALTAMQRPGARAGGLAFALVSLLAIPLWASLRAIDQNVSDSTRLGVVRPSELATLSAYLRTHQGSARYEVAYDSGTKMGSLVVRDARPILVLTTTNARVLTPVARLRALASAGEVRFAILNTLCGPRTPHTDAACSAPAKWVRAHATDVSRKAGLARAKVLWRLPGAATSR